MRIKNIFKPTFQDVHTALHKKLAGENWQATYLNLPDRILITVAEQPELGEVKIERQDDDYISILGLTDHHLKGILLEVVIPMFVDYPYQVVADKIMQVFQGNDADRWLFSNFLLEDGKHVIKAMLYRDEKVYPFTIHVTIENNAVNLDTTFDEEFDAAIQQDIVTYLCEIADFTKM